jgi:hypothetical protein
MNSAPKRTDIRLCMAGCDEVHSMSRGCYALCMMDAALASMMHAKAATCRPLRFPHISHSL